MNKKSLLIWGIFATACGIIAGTIVSRFISVVYTQSILFPIIVSIAGALLIAAGSFIAYMQLGKGEKKLPTLEEKINRLTENLKKSSSVISEIEIEIHKRGQIAEKLGNDVRYYEELKQLNQSQVEAVAQIVRSEMVGESRKSIWRNTIVNFFIALLFFLLGWWIGGI